MNEVEYVLRIVLRARDHMTAALAKARAEIALFSKDVDKFDASVGKLNTRISRLNTRIGNVTDKFAEWRTIMRDFGADTDKVGDATEKVAKKTDDLAKKTGLATKQHKDLQQAVSDLGNKFIKLDQDFRKGKVSREDYIADLDLIGKEYDKLSKKGDIGSELSRSLRNAGNVAREHITNVKQTQEEEVRIVTQAAEARAKAEEDAEKRRLEGIENRKRFTLDLLDTVREREDQMRRNSLALDKAAEEERIRIANNRQQMVSGLDLDTDAERANKVRIAQEKEAGIVADREAKRKQIALQRLQVDIDRTRSEYGLLNDEIERGNIRGETARGNLRAMSSAFARLGRNLDIDRDTARSFNLEAERINNTLRRGEVDVKRYGHEHVRLGEAVRGAGENVSTLDNRLRGIALFAAFAFAQQLISALVALGGELVAVASSAIMAGGAIGGNLVAGIAQAIPVTALLVASLQRVKQVIDAVQQANKLQQQQFVQGNRDQAKAAADTDRITNAQESLLSATNQVSDANDRLSEAQKSQREAQNNLNDARDEAQRNLHDLIQAEKEAELAAKGASLSQKEAQENLRKAILSGDLVGIQRAQLGIIDAQLAKEKALTDLRRQRTDTRAAVTGGVENMDEVVRAKEQLEQARKGVEDANQAIDNANRGVQRAQRGLKSAKRQTTDTAGAMITAQSNLAFLLSQLSPAERRLYEAMTRLQNVYRRVFIGTGVPGSGILGVIIDSFARAVNKATEILQRPDVIKAATGLANEVAKQFDRITDAFTSEKAIGQFLRIIGNAKENLGPINTIIINLGKAFLNIAEAADPAFKKLIEFIDKTVGDFLKITDDRKGLTEFFLDGERHLEAWLTMFGAIGNLIAAVTGEAAGQGLRTVEKFTDFLNNSADKIRKNGEDVRKFFSDTGRAASAIYSVVKTLVVGMIDIFDPKYVENFANFLNKVFIPALLDILKITGWITNLFTSLAQNDFIAGLMRVGFFALIGLQVGASALGVLTYFGRLAGLFKTLAGAALASRINIGRIVGFLGRFVAFLPGLKGIGTAIAGMGTGGAAAAGGSAAARGGVTNIFARRGSPGNPLHVFVVNNIPGGVGGVGGATRSTATRAGRFGGVRAAGGAVVGGAGALIGGPVGAAAIGIPIVLIAASENRARREREARGVGERAEARFGEIANETPARLEKIHDLFEKVRKQEGFAGDELKEWQGLFKRFGAEGTKEVEAVRQALEKVRETTEKALGGLNDRVRRNIARFSIKAGDILDPNAINQVYSNFKRMRESGVTSITDLRKNILFNTEQINKGLAQGSDGWYDAVSGNLSASVAATIDAMDRQVISQRDGWREIRRITRSTWVSIRDNIDNLSDDARDAIASNFASARRAIERQTGGWKNATGDALKEIRKLMRQELELYGLTPRQARNIAKGGGHGRQFGDPDNNRGREGGAFLPATGGIAGGEGAFGQRAKDAIPAFIGRGEAVLGNIHQRYIAPAVEAFYGHPFSETFKRVRGVHAGIGRWAGDNLGFAIGREGAASLFNGHPGNVTPGLRRIIQLLIGKFSNLVVTSTTDHSLRTSSGNISDHSTGHAVDLSGPVATMARAVRYIMGSGLYKSLKQGIHNPGLSIDDGKRVSPSFFGSAWGEHVNHIHLALAGALGKFRTSIAKLIRRRDVMISGPDSPLKDIGAAAIENVRGAANQVLRRVAARVGAQLDGPQSIELGPGGAGEKIFRYFRQRGFSPAQAAAWVGNFVQESNLDPGAVQPNGEGHGLAQWGGARFAALQAFARSRGTSWQNMQTQLDFVWQELQGPESRAYRAIRGARGLEAAVNAIATRYERAGIIGNRLGPAQDALDRFGGQFAHGGIIPGWPGKAIGIVAHGGEWVVNKLQQSRLAQLLGTSASALSSILGFHGSQQGAAGGLNTESMTVDLNKPKVTAIDRLGEITNLFLSIDQLADRSNSALQIIRKLIRDTPKKIGKLAEAFDILTRENGILDQLRNAVERKEDRRGLQLTRSRFKVSRGGVVRETGVSETDVADKELENLRKLREDLVRERGIIERALQQAQRRLKRGGLTDKQKALLRGQINRLRERLDDAQGRVADNVVSIFEAQENAIRTEVDTINANTERSLGRTDIGRRIAEVLGRSTVGFDQQRIELLRNQMNQLQAPLAKAKAQGNTKLADEIQASMDELNVSIIEATQAITQKAIEEINKNSQRRLGRLDLAERMLNATGAVGLAATAGLGGERFSRAGIFEQRGNTLRDQRAQLQEILRGQQSLPIQEQNVQVMNDLIDQIVELDVTIQENTRAAFMAKLEDLNNSSNFSLNVIDLNKQIIELQGQISGNTDQAGLLANAQERANVLATQRAALEQLLLEAQAAGDQEAVNQLTVALLENQVAILQNTQAVNELTGATTEPQGFTSSAWTLFREAIFDGLGHILPQFNVFNPTNPAQVMADAGFFDVADNSSAANSTSTTTETVVNEGDTNINLYGYEQPVDPTEIAATVGFAKKTAQ